MRRTVAVDHIRSQSRFAVYLLLNLARLFHYFFFFVSFVFLLFLFYLTRLSCPCIVLGATVYCCGEWLVNHTKPVNNNFCVFNTPFGDFFFFFSSSSFLSLRLTRFSCLCFSGWHLVHRGVCCEELLFQVRQNLFRFSMYSTGINRVILRIFFFFSFFFFSFLLFLELGLSYSYIAFRAWQFYYISEFLRLVRWCQFRFSVTRLTGWFFSSFFN